GTMTAADLRDLDVEWVDPISTTYRGWDVYELPPNTMGIAALMMLNLMEEFPLARYGFHSARALHVMIEAKKLAYADMLQYVGDPRFTRAPIDAMLDKALARTRAGRIDPRSAARDVQPSVFDGLTTSVGGDTIYLSAIDRHGSIVSMIQSIYEGFGSAIVPRGTGFALHNRGALFTLDETHPNALAPQAPAAHDHPGVHAEGGPQDRLRNHGRLQPGPGPRAVRRQHRRLRPGYPAGTRSGPLHESDVRRRRRQRGGARARARQTRARGARPRGEDCAAADRP